MPSQQASIVLYDNPFSPFARKVRLVLAHKQLPFVSRDSLALKHQRELHDANPRGEVPVLVDGDVAVTNSADIVAYLEHRYPSPPVLPADPGRRVDARAWERLADAVLDSIVHDISIWVWPTHHRNDTPPAGLLEAGMADVRRILARMESSLQERDYLCGEFSVADIAVFPHLSSLKPLGLAPDADTHPRLFAWNQRLRAMPIVQQDLDAVRRAALEKFVDAPSPYEGEKIVWRGDRIEWLFHHGFADWWYEEYRSGRAVVPGSLPESES